MITFMRAVGDRLLGLLVPRLPARAASDAIIICYCKKSPADNHLVLWAKTCHDCVCEPGGILC